MTTVTLYGQTYRAVQMMGAFTLKEKFYQAGTWLLWPVEEDGTLRIGGRVHVAQINPEAKAS